MVCTRVRETRAPELTSTPTPRRSRLVLVAAALFTVAAAVALWLVVAPEPVGRYRIATGVRGGTFLPLGETLARAWTRDVEGASFEAIESPGGLASVEMLEDGRADFALLSNHVRGNESIRLVAVLYEETLQVVVRRDAGIGSPLELRGRRVSVGPDGSGTETIAETVLHHFGIADGDLDRRNLTPAEATELLERGELDAAFIVAGMRTPAVDRLLARDDMRLLSLGEPGAVGSALEGIRIDAPYFAVTTVPERAYGRQPEAAVGTIGVRALLVCRAALEPDLVQEVTRSLFVHKVPLAQEQQLLAHLTEAFDLGLSPYPLHEGADRYYRRDEPPFFQRFADSISLGLTVGALVWSALATLFAARRRTRQTRIEHLYEDARALAKAARDAATEKDRAVALTRLVLARDHAMIELQAERLEPGEGFSALLAYLNAQIAETGLPPPAGGHRAGDGSA